VYFYLTGFDTHFKSCSPGLISLWQNMHFYKQRGFIELDLLRGDEEYKKKITDKTREIEDMLIVRKNVKSFVFLLASGMFGFCKETTRKLVSPRLFAFLKAEKFRKSR
jgi:CelD/BcsL family acetyltransferase involved in cellulose biosynthesis